MIIQTKYNVGQKVWILHRNTIREETVIAMKIEINKRGEVEIVCDIRYLEDVSESELFPSKQALLDSL